MYKIIIQQKHINHQIQQTVLITLALPNRIVGLFFEKGTYLQYDLCKSQQLFRIALKQKPYIAKIINQYQILCTLADSKSLVLINTYTRQLKKLCNLPLKPTYDPYIDKSLFFQTKIVNFNKNKSCYVESPTESGKSAIVYVKSQDLQQQNIDRFEKIREFEKSGLVLQKVDELSKISLYCQKPNKNLIVFRIIDLVQQNKSEMYSIALNSNEQRYTLVEIRSINCLKYIIFINGIKPSILIFDKQTNTCREFGYQSLFNFQQICFLNEELLCFSEFDGEMTDHYDKVVLINLHSQKLIWQQSMTLKNLENSLENDYILEFDPEIEMISRTPIKTFNFINKKSLQLFLMKGLKIQQKYSESIFQQVLELVD